MPGGVSVIIPARNAAGTIERTLQALAAQEVGAPYEVIVVDSGSSDDTVELARRAPIVREVLSNPGGEPAGSRNLGAAHATMPVLAFTDSDCEPDPAWLATGLRALADADIVQGAVRPVGDAGPFDRTLWVLGEHGLYETANLFVRREVFDRAGGFQPVITGPVVRPFGEDVWFVWRAKRDGARVTFEPEALVRHAVFERGLLPFVAERWRCRLFPPLVGRVPELRSVFLYRRWFLSPASFQLDVAVGGVLLGLLLRRRGVAAAAAAGYAVPVAREARRSIPGLRARVAVARVAADVVTLAALVAGSASARTVVL